MYLQTVEFLKQYGYIQYEISNFAKPGYESRHNLKYWQLQEYAGFGPGAHSDFGGVRYAYAKDLDAYIAAARGGQFLLFRKYRHPAPRAGRGVDHAGRPDGVRAGSQGL